ncbi:hypothetical protein [Hyphomicrobium sulfonivorans]|uniref:hypothetical protein n=1 Tax=Hyphomicrobium sulfonivorans TaxID=121290 RepID=UPI001570E8BD|nr:hypothetical protein [Hyphomicrobium sulfonivorans]MBI1650121.1 hypothetical protein [Hyphomicrobium sulfonivorans]NSL73036.1 hypothetical protein [Hyphomicrobium sulfonivorans]
MENSKALKAAVAGRKRDRAFFNCNPDRRFRARRALPHEMEFLRDGVPYEGEWLLVWHNPLDEIICIPLKPDSRAAIVDDEAFLSVMFSEIVAHKGFGGRIRFSGEQALEMRQKAGIQWP